MSIGASLGSEMCQTILSSIFEEEDCMYARYFYQPKGTSAGKSRKRLAFRKVGWCWKTMWWQFLEDCGPRPTGEGGRELDYDELEPIFPRVA